LVAVISVLCEILFIDGAKNADVSERSELRIAEAVGAIPLSIFTPKPVCSGLSRAKFLVA